MKKITLLTALLFLGINANAQCVAGYNAVPGAGAGDFEFTSTSSGSYQFIDFGDGLSTATSTGTTENHTFTANGTYDVCITVSDSDSAGNVSCSDTYCSTITITGLSGCSAGFNAWQGVDSAGNTGPVVWVIDLSSAQSGSALSYLWDFGDGTTSTDQYPTHVYSQLGTFTLCLTIDDGLGCSDTYCEDITVTQKSMGFTLNVIAQGIASTVEEPELFTELTLFPNPTTSGATLELTSAETSDIQVSIVSITGQIVSQELHQTYTGVNQINLNTEELSNGYYFVKINSNNELLKSIQFVKN